MSSINKSGTRFVPKVKQRKRPGLSNAVKKPLEPPKNQLPTPQATQATQATQLPEQVHHEDQEQKHEQQQEQQQEQKREQVGGNESFKEKQSCKDDSPLTPASPISQKVASIPKSPISQPIQVQITPVVETQAEVRINNLNDTSAKHSVDTTTAIKPRRDSTVSVTSNRADFLTPSIRLRRDSEIKNISPSTTTRSINLTTPTSKSHEAINAAAVYQRQRRLSSLSSDGPSITGSKVRRTSSVSGGRSGSIGILPPIFGPRSRRGSTTSVIESESETGDSHPVKIGIPVGVPQKRRRSSAGGTSGRRRRKASINVAPSVVEEGDEGSNNADIEKPVSDKPIIKKTIRFQEPSNIGIPNERRISDSENVDPLANDETINTENTDKDSDNSKVKLKDDKDDNIFEAGSLTQEKSTVTEEEKLAKARYYIHPVTKKMTKLKGETVEDLEYAPGHKMIDHMRSIGKLSKFENHKLLDGFIINDNTMTLSELTKRTIPFGEVSKSYEQAMEGDKLRNQKKIERKLLRKRARRERVNPDQLLGDDEDAKERERAEQTKQLLNNDREDRGQHNGIQLQFDAGHITYNTESTVVDRHSSNFDNESRERVVENPYENPVTSATYSKRKVTERWSPQEVAELYRALSTWGTDFGLIAQLFPYRTRKQIKAKFLSEEKARPHLIEFALLRKLPGDLDEYTGKTGKTFKSLDVYEGELKELKVKHDKEIKEMAAAKERAKVEDTHRAKVAYESSTGSITRVSAKSRKAVLVEFRKNEEVVGTIDSK